MLVTQVIRILGESFRKAGVRWRSDMDRILWSTRLHKRLVKATQNAPVPFSSETETIVRETIHDFLIDAMRAGAVLRPTRV